MKSIILAGGFGTRISEETITKPKPMVEIGGRPILWHIMNIYATYEITEFIIALGYKGDLIKEYFLNFYALNNNVSIDLETGSTTVHDGRQPKWKIHLVDTGLHTKTGGRLKRLEQWLGDDETFMMTYGDGVGNIDIGELLTCHQKHGRLATVTAVRPPARFGEMVFSGSQVTRFIEKPQASAGWINGGYFVLNRKVLEYVDNDQTVWESEPLDQLAINAQLMAFFHEGFWQPMDTLRDRKHLEELWASGNAPWKVW